MNKNGTEKPVLQAERIRLSGAASFSFFLPAFRSQLRLDSC